MNNYKTAYSHLQIDPVMNFLIKKFGSEIAELVEGVTKLSRLENKNREFTLAENFRKLILATSKDIRVLLVKLADRLHNMRTIDAISKIEKKESLLFIHLSNFKTLFRDN